LPLHISLVLSLALHLALYTLGDWAGWHATPPPSLRLPIEAMLILPEIKPVPSDSAPAEKLPEPSSEAALPQTAAAPVVEPPRTAPPATAKTVTAPSPEKPQPAVSFYPRDAVLRGLEGDVEIGVTLDPAGNVIAARLDRGSGHAILDEAALAAARTLKGLPGGAREATLPVRFRLK